MDAALSITDHHALDIHARVERWALDEVPLPGKLVHQIVEWLYRENRFCRGALKVGTTLVGPFSLSIPTLAVLNTADEVAPLASIKPFTDAMPAADVRIIEYPGELGICLQHLGDPGRAPGVCQGVAGDYFLAQDQELNGAGNVIAPAFAPIVDDWARQDSAKALGELVLPHTGATGTAFAWELQRRPRRPPTSAG